jgi:hypothetical protein
LDALDEGLEQSITYAVSEGVEYFVVTDGIRWRVYSTFRRVKTSEKLLFAVDPSSGADHKHVMDLLWLWRGNFVLDSEPSRARLNQVTAASPKETTDHAGSAAGADVGTIRVASTQPLSIPPPDWMQSLDLLELLNSKTGNPPPRKIRFPDGTISSLGTWRDVQYETVKWLSSVG